MKFDLRRPCKDCPFIVDTSMVLRPGRMQDIAASLRDDYHVFPCHKTTNDTNDDDEGGYRYDGTEQACMGALAYTLREYDMLPVMARIVVAREGTQLIDALRAQFDQIEQPDAWRTDDDRPRKKRAAR